MFFFGVKIKGVHLFSEEPNFYNQHLLQCCFLYCPLLTHRPHMTGTAASPESFFQRVQDAYIIACFCVEYMNKSKNSLVTGKQLSIQNYCLIRYHKEPLFPWKYLQSKLGDIDTLHNGVMRTPSKAGSLVFVGGNEGESQTRSKKVIVTKARRCGKSGQWWHYNIQNFNCKAQICPDLTPKAQQRQIDLPYHSPFLDLQNTLIHNTPIKGPIFRRRITKSPIFL